MQSKSDSQLLREYAADRSEAAFGEIVARHTDLVYSAALRQTGSPELAREASQSVFTDLARKARIVAGALPANGSLAGWLYRGTRYAGLTLLRDERRRQIHERQVMEQLNIGPKTAPDWERVAPVLDEAMAELGDADREAVLLRFFKNQDFNTIGRALGVSDDAAQKRVSRAVEHLRVFMAKRGVTVGAGSLAAVITANAVQAAPAGLSTLIAATALSGSTIIACATAAVGKAIAMTTVQKSLTAATLAAAVGTGIYEANQASTLRMQVRLLQQEQASQAAQIIQMSRDREAAANRLSSMVDEMERSKGDPAELAKLRAEVARLKKAGSQTDPADKELVAWLGRVKKLRQFADQNPGLRIPEFALLTGQDWLDETRNKAQFETRKDLEDAMAGMRMRAQNNFATIAGLALKRYVNATSVFPPELSSLTPYFKQPVGYEILQQYTIERAETEGVEGWEWVITNKLSPNEKYAEHIIISPTGWQRTPGPPPQDPELTAIKLALEPLTRAFSAANDGQEPTDPLQLEPFVTTPDQRAAFRKLVDLRNAPRTRQ